jgi:DNA-directed RNA polymerase subunit beta
MKGRKITYVPRDQVDLELPAFEDAFSPLGNLVPLKSMVKGQRVAMASRMLTQALPLVGAEAPLVQGAVPGSGGATSFEEEYGPHMGAVRAERAGRVVSVRDGVVRVRYDDGSTDDIELYEHFPFNRKTYIHQRPTVHPGEHFKAGQLLVTSNYTDATGATALGINARVAYLPYKGYNFEDALVISEGMAKRMSSEHMYQHEVEADARTKLGKKAYVSLFSQKYEKPVLDRMDENGVIKVGEEVEFGQPLILAARERDRAQNKVHKQRQAGFNDASVVWKHHDKGIVTDVVRGRKGPVVLVKSISAMQIGDKMSGRYGDKGVIAAIVPDAKMPHGADGKPYEVLLNPLGVISRTNPAQKVEAMLGKIARLTGKPAKVSDFESVADMTEYAERELAKHGLKDLEDVTDPETGRRVRGIATGERFFMKLHHTSESKQQARGSGGYGLDETPSKGGETGCFAGDTLLICRGPLGRSTISVRGIDRSGPQGTGTVNIGCIVENRLDLDLPTGRVTDFFSYRVPPERLVEIELENGSRVVVTTNHKLFRPDGTVVLAGDVTAGDDLAERLP